MSAGGSAAGSATSGFDCFAGRSRVQDGRIVETATVPLWCHEEGLDDGEPVLLVGGFTAGHFVYDFSRPQLAGYRLIAWEPRGLGASACPDPSREPYSIATWSEDLLALMDALGLERAHIWAAGFGSYIAHRFAARHPERLGAYVTYTDVWADDPQKAYPKIWKVYSAIAGSFGTTGFGARVLANVFDVSDVPWFGSWEARNIEEVLHPETVAATVGYCLTQADVREELAGIEAPTLVLQGDRTWDGRTIDVSEDPSLELMRERVGNLEVQLIADAHPGYVAAQKPAEYGAAARAFLARHPLR
ncbi:MAG: alpha/beta fold hydrolase [Solirubrobacteraceae bacterium]